MWKCECVHLTVAVCAIVGDEHGLAVGGAVTRHTRTEVAAVGVVTPAVIATDLPQLTLIFICDIITYRVKSLNFIIKQLYISKQSSYQKCFIYTNITNFT